MTKDQYAEAISIYERINRSRKKMQACEEARKSFEACIYVLKNMNTDKDAAEYVKEKFLPYIVKANRCVLIDVFEFLCKRLKAKERKERIDMFYLDKGIQSI